MPRSIPLVITLLAVGALAFAACGDDDDGGGDMPSTAITTKEFTFDAPASINGGLNRLTLKNTGKESHQAQLLKLNDGVTLESFAAAAQKSEEAVFALVSFAGGPAAVGPKGEAEVVVDLKAGQYVMVCFIPSPDGVPHLAKGMVKPLEVKAATAAQPSKPEAKGKINLTEFAFDMPESVPAGKTTFEVVNAGKQPHEASLIRLKEGVTPEQLKQALSAPPGAAPAGPPPAEDVGGFQAIAPGGSGWMTIDLKRGNYALICFVPDSASGAPHVALGMVDPFTVK